MQELKRIGVRSAFRLGIVIYGVLGLVFSLIMLIFGASALGSLPFGSAMGRFGVSLLGVMLGTGVYAVMGGVMWALGALIYNFLANKVGGIEIEVS